MREILKTKKLQYLLLLQPSCLDCNYKLTFKCVPQNVVDIFYDISCVNWPYFLIELKANICFNDTELVFQGVTFRG